jgi:hypothetical protein
VAGYVVAGAVNCYSPDEFNSSTSALNDQQRMLNLNPSVVEALAVVWDTPTLLEGPADMWPKKTIL